MSVDLNAGDGVQIGVGVVLALTLLAVVAYTIQTGRLANETKKMTDAAKAQAEATVSQAEASVTMAEEMRKQRLIVVQPIVAPSLKPVDKERRSIVATVTNVGNGPAFDVLISLERVDKSKGVDDPESVQVLNAGDERHLEFRPRYAFQRKWHSDLEKNVNIFRFGKYRLIASYRDLYGNPLSAVRSFELMELRHDYGTQVYGHLRNIEFSGYEVQPGGTAGG